MSEKQINMSEKQINMSEKQINMSEKQINMSETQINQSTAQFDDITAKYLKNLAKMNSKDIRPCPSCRMMLRKIGGCESVNCSMCGTTFWWPTGEIYDDAVGLSKHWDGKYIAYWADW